MTTTTLKSSQIEISTENPRKKFDDAAIKGLAQSIKIDGLIQHLTVAKPKGKKKKHPIICGERRFRAIQYLIENGDLPKDYEIAVEIKEGLSEEEILRIATMENMQREDLTPLEEAQAITMLIQDGKKLDDILAQTGLSESTIKRRLVLTGLSPAAKQALTDGEITLSKAEVLSMVSHEEQDSFLDMAKSDYYDTEEIRDRLIGDLPTLAIALFDKDLYTGRFTHDLLAEDDETYFDDVEQFYDLQKAAAENLVESHRESAEWAELLEGYFSSWEYRKASEDETGGVVIELRPDGKVNIHERLIRTKADKATTKALKKPRPTYATPLVRYMAQHKSIAVQAALLENPRTMKEIIVVGKLAMFRYRSHDHLSYFNDAEILPPALLQINEAAKHIYALFAKVQEDTAWQDFRRLFSSHERAYDHVKTLKDEDLDAVLVFLEALEFGQCTVERLDTNENSLFNKVATDLGVDMKKYWRPDEPFLKRRNKVQLQKIITEAGCSLKFGSAAGHKKKDLVAGLAKHFQHVLTLDAPSADDLKAREWLPEAMQFPAIAPDAKPQQEDFEQDDEELAEAA